MIIFTEPNWSCCWVFMRTNDLTFYKVGANFVSLFFVLQNMNRYLVEWTRLMVGIE